MSIISSNNDSPLLSICIPTYNREKFLRESLESLIKQINDLPNPSIIELIISDNCSTDNTETVVRSIINTRGGIIYIRNSRNLGMDGNFVNCFKRAKGKYIWLLGDDDYLIECKLSLIIEQLESGDFGLIHLAQENNTNRAQEYSNYQTFVSKISYYITFISANIVKREYVKEIDFEEYFGSLFSQIPLYLTAAKGKNNLIIYDKILDTGKNSSQNGGYNLFKTFVTTYLSIIRPFYISRKAFNKEKYNLIKGLLLPYIQGVIIGKPIGVFETKGMFRILFKFYWNCPKSYILLSKQILKSILLKFKLL